MLIYPFYAVMFVDAGLTAMEISVLFAVWGATVIVLEVPSGVLADRYSRKRILFLAQWIRALGYLCWMLFPGFWGFLAGFVLWGTQGALASGTFEALVYDELKRLDGETAYVKVIGSTRSCGFLGMIAAALVASAIVDRGYEVLLLGSLAAVLAAGAMVVSLPAAPPVESTAARGYLAVLRQGLADAVRQPLVPRLIAFTAVVVAMAGGLDEYATIFADEAGLPRYGLGLFLALLCAIQAIAGVIAHRFEGLPTRWFCAAVVVGGLLLLVAAWWMTPAAIVLLALFFLVFQVIEIVLDGRLQRVIPSRTRATVSSVRGFSVEVAGILVFLSMGWIVGSGPYRDGFLVFGAVAIVLGLAYTLWGARGFEDAGHLPPGDTEE